jgi:hypothetical protein
VKNHGTTPRMSQLTGAIMASHSKKNYRTGGDASRFPSTPTTYYSPPKDPLQTLTTEWMDDALPAIGSGEDTTQMLINMYL